MSNKCIIELSDGSKLFAEDVNDDMIQSIIKSDSCKVIYNDEEYYKAMNIPIITGDSDTDELLEDERIAQLEGQSISSLSRLQYRINKLRQIDNDILDAIEDRAVDQQINMMRGK